MPDTVFQKYVFPLPGSSTARQTLFAGCVSAGSGTVKSLISSKNSFRMASGSFFAETLSPLPAAAPSLPSSE
jgi:hypothetical protein